jgi:hypothetical protein
MFAPQYSKTQTRTRHRLVQFKRYNKTIVWPNPAVWRQQITFRPGVSANF